MSSDLFTIPTAKDFSFNIKGNKKELETRAKDFELKAYITILPETKNIEGFHYGTRIVKNKEDTFIIEANGYGKFQTEIITYEGIFMNNLFHDNTGKAIYCIKENIRYIGCFKEGKRNGLGKLERYNQNTKSWNIIYEGEWKDDNINGKGKMTFIDGSSYEGEFKEGKKEGKGTYNHISGTKYEGEWKNGMMNGKGCAIYNDECIYEGEWKNNKKHGIGKFFYRDRSVYEGEWENNKRHGKGRYTKSIEGCIYTYESKWEYGEMCPERRRNRED
jgi:hypothetical protein